MGHNLMIFSGNSNLVLAEKIIEYIRIQGKEHVSLGKALVTTFSDGENRIEIRENVKNRDVYVIQSTCSPAGHNLIELGLMLDAIRRAKSQRLVAVMPYFGFARQDKKTTPRTPISAKVVIDFIIMAGADVIVTMDLHANQIQGFTNNPFHNIYARPALLDYIVAQLEEEIVIVSPDAGGAERARSYAKKLGTRLAIIDKRREGPNQSEAMHLLGDVSGMIAVIIDDIVDTAGTLKAGAELVLSKGAKEVHACIVHPVLSGNAVEKINGSELKSLIVTDTIPLNEQASLCNKIKVVSVANIFGEAICRINAEDALSSLF
jgi:ribose-phosphate pyrophosphokinase